MRMTTTFSMGAPCTSRRGAFPEKSGGRGDSLTHPRGLDDECGGAMGLTGARWRLVGPISHVNASFMLCGMRVVAWRIVMVWTRASI